MNLLITGIHVSSSLDKDGLRWPKLFLPYTQCRGKAAPYPPVEGGPDYLQGPHNIYCISKLEPSLYP